eukprot:2061087-Prymnesium_polylepis.3
MYGEARGAVACRWIAQAQWASPPALALFQAHLLDPQRYTTFHKCSLDAGAGLDGVVSGLELSLRLNACDVLALHGLATAAANQVEVCMAVRRGKDRESHEAESTIHPKPPASEHLQDFRMWDADRGLEATIVIVPAAEVELPLLDKLCTTDTRAGRQRGRPRGHVETMSMAGDRARTFLLSSSTVAALSTSFSASWQN